MVTTLTSADNALKNLYLGVVANQLNTSINPLLAKIGQTTADVWGKEVIKMSTFGLNGGVGSGTEDGSLPTAHGNNYVKFKSELKNLYGKLEISDKAIRASENNLGAFVNLLNAEMQGLIDASTFNLGRMLYGDGDGLVASVTAISGANITVDSVKYLMEGMAVDLYNDGTLISTAKNVRINTINRATKVITLNCSNVNVLDATDVKIYVQNSKGNDITGLGKIFDQTQSDTIYGLTRSAYPFLTAKVDSVTTSITDIAIQKLIDDMEEIAGSKIDYIVCSAGVKRAYQSYLATNTRNVDVMNLQGGYRAISFGGIPVVSDRFCPDKTMYLLDTTAFSMHQLCDWKWLEGENGRVIHQNASSPTYSATLVKYAELICDKISGQAKFSNITES